MRLSCNGCRMLRKGCSDDCSIRPCLQWIKSPESQGNATLFLAKYYGRAGLLNLINAGPDHLRPAIFLSLLYEACGRIVNPTYGSVGLLCSGKWQLCQDAVDAVLEGAPIMQMSSDTTADSSLPALHKAASYNIRHIAKGAFDHDLHKVHKANRLPFKRSGLPKPKPPLDFPSGTLIADLVDVAHAHDNLRWRFPIGFQREPSHDSSATQASEPSTADVVGGSNHGNGENESAFSVETAEASMVTSHDVEPTRKSGDRVSEKSEVGLELTLGCTAATARMAAATVAGTHRVEAAHTQTSAFA